MAATVAALVRATDPITASISSHMIPVGETALVPAVYRRWGANTSTTVGDRRFPIFVGN